MASMKELFNVRAPADALQTLIAALAPPRQTERVPTEEALDRVLAAPLLASEALPAFARSTMDGFAVRAADTFGASEGLPAYLTLVDEVLMGQAAERARCGRASAPRIATGGMLPAGADAVVMVEQTQEVGPRPIEVLRPVAPGENVVQVGEDVRAGRPAPGARPRAATAGPGRAAGAGHHRGVASRAACAWASSRAATSSCPPDRQPGPGQIRDINSYTLAALVRRGGHEPCSGRVAPRRATRRWKALARAGARTSRRADPSRRAARSARAT